MNADALAHVRANERLLCLCMPSVALLTYARAPARPSTPLSMLWEIDQSSGG